MCYGEALIDFLQTGAQEIDGLPINEFRQFPGGAPANAAVALAKLGGEAKFVGQVGEDKFGDFLAASLNRYQVDTSCLQRHPTAPTALAFVHLDNNRERSFTFFRDNSADLVLKSEQINADWFKDATLLHLCSNTLTTKAAALTTQTVVDLAKVNQLSVSIDVNLRANLWPAGKVDVDLVNRFVKQAQLVKFAKEEFELLSEGHHQSYLTHCFNAGCKLIIVTNGGHDIAFFTPHSHGIITPPSVNVVDTTAGGDGFIGALLYVLSQLVSLDVLLKNFSLLRAALFFSSCSGALAVSKAGAFPALPKRRELLDLFSQQPQELLDPDFMEYLTNGIL
ncbi:carbohydrate kinase, PfkB family [Pseudoalteromonas luteoviolacea B = ATCC 29581]|nr:carbohydrate kinase, PfkB family [Pseudoalteromonas luteoviolacea B = ATCC 29581]